MVKTHKKLTKKEWDRLRERMYSSKVEYQSLINRHREYNTSGDVRDYGYDDYCRWYDSKYSKLGQVLQ